MNIKRITQFNLKRQNTLSAESKRPTGWPWDSTWKGLEPADPAHPQAARIICGGYPTSRAAAELSIASDRPGTDPKNASHRVARMRRIHPASIANLPPFPSIEG